MRFHQCPLVISQEKSGHGKLLSELESLFNRFGNPESQQTLDDNDTILVTAPDFPEVVTFGHSRKETLHYAVGAFREMIAAKIFDKEPIPKPTRIRVGETFVILPLQTEREIRAYEAAEN